jgi:hypothetical protein
MISRRLTSFCDLSAFSECGGEIVCEGFEKIGHWAARAGLDEGFDGHSGD